MSYVPPKFTDKDGKVYEGDIAWKKFGEKLCEFFRPTIPDEPFAHKAIKFTDKHIPPSNGYRELLTDAERQLLQTAVPELSDAGLEAVLRDIFNMGDERIKTLTWREVFIFCKHYVSKIKEQQDLTKNVLDGIAYEIEKLLLKNKNRFDQYSNNFHKKWTAFQKAIQKTKFAIGKPVPKKLLDLDPQKKLRIGIGAILPETQKDQLWRSYIWLIIIHDSLLKSNVPIDDSKVKPLKELYTIIQEIITDTGEKHPILKREGDNKSGMFYIEAALNEVKADLTKEKWRKQIISWICKKTSHIVYVVIAFFVTTIFAAILVDIFADFGWLHSIKAFIYKILLHR